MTAAWRLRLVVEQRMSILVPQSPTSVPSSSLLIVCDPMMYDPTQVCDPKSLLYLFGMQLDWSSALIGGGFAFHNPNAESSCGCGKSFGV